METIQLQCGHCKQVIAIGVEHLGGQVQCPHCKGVLQTPARAAPPAAAAVPDVELNPRENVFAGPESSEVALGEPAAPKAEPPSAPGGDLPVAANTGVEPDADLTKFKSRPVFDRGVFTMYALIFLVPYAVLMTLAVIYFVFAQSTSSRIHPFDMLPDPVPGGNKGGPKKVGGRFDPLHPLADHQKVALGKPITVGKDGDLVVTPEKVRLTDAGNLQLFLRAKNVSKNTAFKPIDDVYVRYDKKEGSDLYTFLESASGSPARIIGAYLNFRKNLKDEDAGRDSLGPGDETVIMLETDSSYQKLAAAIAQGNDTYTWRVQLRRGFVKYQGKDRSATAVIGVEFKSDQIEREKKS